MMSFLIAAKSTLAWAHMSYRKQQLILNLPENQKNKKQLTEILLAECPLPSIDRIRAIRNWTNINSIHKIDKEHDQYAFQIDQVLKKLLDYHNNKQSRPHLSCGPRSYAMKELMKLVGIQSRVIDIFQISDGVVNPHTLLEVYCPDSGKWILQDPDFNTEYVLETQDQIPLCSEDMLLADKSQIRYSTNGYNIENKLNCNNTIDDCFDQCVLQRLSYDGKRSIAFVKDKAVLNDRVSSENKKRVFSQFLAQRGHNPRIIELNQF